MATNAKESEKISENKGGFKYSRLCKGICIVLCLLTFISGFVLCCSAALTNYYYGTFDSISEDGGYASSAWTENYLFSTNLYSDVQELMEYTYSSAQNSDLYNELSDNEDAIVDEVYEQYLKKKDYVAYYYGSTSDDGTDYGADDSGVSATAASIPDTVDLEISVAAFVDQYSYTNYFTINAEDILLNAASSSYNSEESPEKGYIRDCYEIYINDTLENIYCYESYEVWQYAYSMNISAEYNGVIEGNRELNADSVRSAVEENGYEYYLIYENGKLEYGGLPQSAVNEINDYIINSNDYSKNTNLYLYFTDFPSESSFLLNPAYWNDHYVTLYYFHSAAQNIYNSLLEYYIISAALILISFVFGFIYFTRAGKTADGVGKQIFVDKLPFELHFILSAGIGAGAFMLWLLINDRISEVASQPTIIAAAVLAAVLWAVLFEFCSSCFRTKHIRGGIKDTFLCVSFAQTVAAWSKSLKSLFTYKPKAMRRNVILLSAAFVIGNTFLSALSAYGMSEVNFFIGIMMFLALLCVNIIVIKRVGDYFKTLDIIITAFSNRQTPNVDASALPSSLARLCESMEYTQDELQAAVTKAIKDERLRSELITNVSHDLKTPLTSIINYVNLLTMCDITDENALKYIKVLDEKGARLKRLIEDLIEASKVTSGNITVNLAVLNLAELTLQSTVDAQSDFEKANLDLIVKDCEHPPMVIADGKKAFRVIENLLSNARKYSAPGSRVYVEVYTRDNCGVFEIKNISAQPLDISPDELTERFVRGDKSRNLNEGNGLGLSIAKELCKLQNGALELVIDGDLFKARMILPSAESDIPNASSALPDGDKKQ